MSILINIIVVKKEYAYFLSVSPLKRKEVVINTFTTDRFSETKPFMHLSKHVFQSQ